MSFLTFGAPKKECKCGPPSCIHASLSDLEQQPERLGGISISEISFAAWTNYMLGMDEYPEIATTCVASSCCASHPGKFTTTTTTTTSDGLVIQTCAQQDTAWPRT